MTLTKLPKRDKEWLSGLALHLRGIAAALEGSQGVAGWHSKANAPKDLRGIAEALERVGGGKL